MNNKNNLYSNKYSVAYIPYISDETKKRIVDNIEYTMVDEQGNTFIYPLEQVLEALEGIIDENDYKKLSNIKKESIDYIEF